jgi:hypothetical protein
MSTSNILVNTTKTDYRGLTGLRTHMRRDIFVTPKPRSSSRMITVGKLLSPVKPVPKGSILLGKCKDDLPFLMQLTDPVMGAILIGGDAACGKTHQLQVMVDSAMRLNAPHDFQVSILTHKPYEWRSFWRASDEDRYLYQIKAWYDPSAEELIEGLVHLAEVRREGERQGAGIFLVPDDFNFVEDLSYEAQVNLHWLLAYGAQSGIWIAAAIKANYAERFRYWIDCFRTRIVGSMGDSGDADILSCRNDSLANTLQSGYFRVWTGTEWLSYSLPLLGD